MGPLALTRPGKMHNIIVVYTKNIKNTIFLLLTEAGVQTGETV